ncbi:L-seryl-tRNA(Sec) kinase [Pezoporus flaviventris]|uniref:L-seryl-tRNA(Sec) kinase n=1 Tax=Pezoporus flaviventris TaxID=889875 RepID=UPI002AAF4C75|nr:L-seryl-tRNA(Sec) kinase [Pezoporus flaviventris]
MVSYDNKSHRWVTKTDSSRSGPRRPLRPARPAHARSRPGQREPAAVAALEAAAEDDDERGGGGGGRVGLCVLCGLPAAGKSSLARGLRRRLLQRQGWACALLTYDELIPPEAFRPREPGAEPNPSLPDWKQSRRALLQCLECLLRALLTGDPLAAPSPSSQPTWERFMACCQRQGLLRSMEGGGGRYCAHTAESGPLYIILDDNFYYQSMRYEVFQLARKYSLSYCQIFLESSLECCLQRNQLRSHPLPDQTIHLMASKIEMPDLKKNAWEQNSLILQSSDCTSENEQIIALLAAALENPVKQNEENAEQKEADRAICAASAVHQADQTCRRLVSQAMKEARDKNIQPSELKSLAEELNKLKAEFLEDMRQGNHLKSQLSVQNQCSDPDTSVISLFQLEAANIVNKYILK